jgi:hypothetical protein
MPGRPDGLTVGIAAFLLLAVWPSGRLAAQVSLRASLGARFSTALVKDSIVVPIALKPGVGPALQLSVRDDLRGPWTGDITVDVALASLKREESGTSFDAGSATVTALTFGLRRDVYKGLAARLGLGGLVYMTENTGVFEQGNGGIFPLMALDASYAPAFGTKRGLAIALQYDVHRFLTPALRTTGFPNPRPVHRLALSVSARLFGQ